MNSSFELLYAKEVAQSDIPRLSPDVKDRIKKIIESKLTFYPHKFGQRLRRDLKNFWKLRIGDYRVIYKISGKIVEIQAIGHRREIYARFLR